MNKRKITQLLAVFGGAVSAIAFMLALPVLAGLESVERIAPQAFNFVRDAGLIAYTSAQTMTLSEVTTETGNIVANYVPSLAIFIAAAVVFSLGAFFVARLLRAGRSG